VDHNPEALMRVSALPFFTGFILLISSPALAQDQPTAGTIPGFSKVEAHEYDSINLATLGIKLNVPVRSKAGHIPFTDVLTGDVAITKHTQIQSPNHIISYFYASPGLSGIETHLGGRANWSSQTPLVYCGGSQYISFYNWVYTDAAGTTHPTGIPQLLDGNNSSCGTISAGAYTKDGSGIYVYEAGFPNYGGYAIDMNGNKSLFRGSQFTDANGNSISRSSSGNTQTYTDTLGQTVLTVTTSTSSPLEIDSWTDALGNTQSLKYYSNSLTLNTYFGSGCGWPANTPTTWNFPASVLFPDSSSVSYGWEKTYNNNSQYTGRLASITLPTGGTISYTYSGGTNGVNCDGTPATMKRTTSDGTWTYTHVPDGSGTAGAGTTTVTDPQGNSVVYTFVGANIPLMIFSGLPLETERQVHDPQNNLLQTVITCYNNTSSSPTNCNPSPLTLPITEKDVYTTYPGVTGYSAVKTAYDTYGRVTDVKTFDFNASSPTNEKQVTYGSGNPSTQTCTAISTYIIGKPCSVTLLDSQHSNAILSQTWNAYDSNGNLTQTWSLVSGSGSSGTYLSKQYTYDSHGVVQTATDVNGQVMNYTTTSCNNMFVTSQYPTGFSNLQTSQTWDCNGGVVTSATDANGQTTHSLFSVNSSSDPFYRPLESVDQLGNITSFSYTPTTLESVFSFNGGSSVIDTLSTTDSIARPVVSQLRQGPGSTNWNAKSRTFDGTGRPYQTTLPCVSTAGAACSTQAETQTYDGLNRPLVHTTVGGEVVTKAYVANDVRTTLTPAPANENAKATQREFDGLGRLKSECLISSASGSGPCGQANGGTGFLTKYTYDATGRLLNTVENAQVSSPQQTRSYTYDLLGRVLTETNPESGTTHNTYDSVTGTNCTSSSAGDLVQKIDANGNTSCYFYDGLHRNIKTTYAGPNSNGVSKFFV
jgi:YD repeat-containing protein